MVNVKQLLEYNEAVRHEFFAALTRLPWKDFVQNKEASFGSIRNIFVHTIGATDYWLDFLQNEKRHSRKGFDEYKTFGSIEAYMGQVEQRMHDYLNSLPAEGLEKKFTVKNDAEEVIEITAEDVLIHVFEEEVHHRGELIALLWQMGVEPPLMGWKKL